MKQRIIVYSVVILVVIGLPIAFFFVEQFVPGMQGGWWFGWAIGGLAVIVSCVYWWWGKKAKQAIIEAAESLQLPRTSSKMYPDSHIYMGKIDGVRVKLALVRMQIGTGTMVTSGGGAIKKISVQAYLDPPLNFKLAFVGPHLCTYRSFTIGDEEFDREVAIITDQEVTARRILTSLALREELKSFIKDNSSACLNMEGASVGINRGGAEAVVRAVRQAVNLCRHLSSIQ